MLKNKKGFTLVELLVVIAIIGTLSGIVLVSLGGARAKARDAVRQSDMRQIVTAEEIYYSNNNAYFTNDGAADGIPAISTYLSGLDDPLGGEIHYTWTNNIAALDCPAAQDAYDAIVGQWFCAYATLEESGTDTVYFVSTHLGTKKLDLAAAPAATAVSCTCFAW